MPAADDAKTKSGHNKPGNERNQGFSHRTGSRSESADSGCSLPEKQQNNFRRFVSKKTLLYATGVVLAALALLGPLVFFQPAKATLVVDNKTYTLDIASTEAQREQGLGGRASLADDRGMIFVFESENPECFWMKDMQFPIDIIWLDDQKRVVHVERRVSPDTFPDSFCPSEPAKYVIELAAGQAEGIKTGQTLSF